MPRNNKLKEEAQKKINKEKLAIESRQLEFARWKRNEDRGKPMSTLKQEAHEAWKRKHEAEAESVLSAAYLKQHFFILINEARRYQKKCRSSSDRGRLVPFHREAATSGAVLFGSDQYFETLHYDVATIISNSSSSRKLSDLSAYLASQLSQQCLFLSPEEQGTLEKREDRKESIIAAANNANGIFGRSRSIVDSSSKAAAQRLATPAPGRR